MGILARQFIVGLLGVLLLQGAQAAIDVFEFDDEAQRARYQTFIDEMRCPKCQNQNLSGSDSPIAADLRRELHRLLQEGYSDEQIVDFMVARYGDFILYKPRIQSSTYLLWLAPLGLLLLALLAGLWIWRSNRTAVMPRARQQDQQAQLKALLEQNPGQSQEQDKP